MLKGLFQPFLLIFIAIGACFGFVYLSAHVSSQIQGIYKFVDANRRQTAENLNVLEKKIVALENGIQDKAQYLNTSSNTNSKSRIDLQKSSRNAIVQVFSDALEMNWLEPYQMPKQHEAKGSGFFIDDEGHFLTNYHVVGNSLRVQIQMPSLGQDRLDCTVIGVCPERDLALLKVSQEAIEKIQEKLGKIQFLKLGDSDKTSRGEEVMTLGFPLGKHFIKNTTGAISGWELVKIGERGSALTCLEIDAPINPGSSGGPAVNSDGEVIGINFAIISGANNIGYVLPINELKSSIKDLQSIPLLRKPKLGCLMQKTTPEFAEYFNNPQNGGFYFEKVMKGSLAEKSGLKSGDTIYELEGFHIDRNGDTVVPWREDKIPFLDILHRLEVGDTVHMVIYRNGTRKEINFVLTQDAKLPNIRVVYPGHEEIDYEVFGGMVIMELSLNHIFLMCEHFPRLIRYASLEHQDKKALIITHVQPTSEAHNSRDIITMGKIIEKVNGNQVSSLQDLRTEIKNNISQNHISIESEDYTFCVLDMKKILANETRLAKMFKYDPEHSEILRHMMLQK